MSASPTRHRSAPSLRVSPAVSNVQIEWAISRMAMGDRAPKGTSAIITLRYVANPNSNERWTLHDPRSDATTTLDLEQLPRTIANVRTSGGCVHIHSPSMYAFVSIENDEPQLLYARTRIFESLKLAGGRYQPQSVTVQE